ncbi:MAG: hypothetical protein ABH803_04505 [Candidatus Micrarchaeota archaeon]
MSRVNFKINLRKDWQTNAEQLLHEINVGGVNKRKLMEYFQPPLKKVNSIIELRTFTEKYYQENKRQINASKKRISKAWQKIELKYISEIEAILKHNFKSNYKGYLSIFPNNQLFLEKNSFQIFYKLPFEQTNRIIAHELIHFIHFDYCQQYFEKTKWANFSVNTPGWHLSEMVVTLILNEPNVKKMFKLPIRGYPSHYRILPVFQKIYQNTGSFNEFMKEAIKHESLLNIPTKDLTENYFKTINL